MTTTDCYYKKVCSNECSPNCLRLIMFNKLLELSNLPEMYQHDIPIYSTKYDQERYIQLDAIKNDIKSFVDNGKNLYICSKSCGNAKTSWSSKLMLSYFDKIWDKSFDIASGIFVNIPTFLIDLKNFNDRPEYISNIKDAKLVIWDDLAFSRLTDYEHEQLLQYIDYRIANKKSNIYTSNITSYEMLVEAVGHRLASRIYNCSEVIEFMSDDFRAGGNL